MRLSVKELKEELRKREQNAKEKEELRACLKEAIVLNVPIASSNEAPRHESIAGLDITARRELFTPNEEPVPEPENLDTSHWLPTERDATVNLKYCFQETSVRVPFMGTTEKMAYTRPQGRNANRKKTQQKKKASPTWHSHPTMPVGPRRVGGPNANFLE